jgi:hypothetical protein
MSISRIARFDWCRRGGAESVEQRFLDGTAVTQACEHIHARETFEVGVQGGESFAAVYEPQSHHVDQQSGDREAGQCDPGQPFARPVDRDVELGLGDDDDEPPRRASDSRGDEELTAMR